MTTKRLLSGRRGGPAPAAEIVRAVFEQLEQSKTLCREDVEERWEAIAGKTAARHSRPVVLRKKILTISIDSPAWLHELSIRKRMLLKQLKRAFGKDRIAEIQLKIGEI